MSKKNSIQDFIKILQELQEVLAKVFPTEEHVEVVQNIVLILVNRVAVEAANKRGQYLEQLQELYNSLHDKISPTNEELRALHYKSN